GCSMPSRRFLAAFSHWAARQPDALALVQGDRLVSYARLAEAAAEARAAVAVLRMPYGATVCVPAEKSPQVIALIIGCLQAGTRVFLPSPDLGTQAMAELCAEVGCLYVLTPHGVPRRIGDNSSPRAGDEPGLLLTTSGSTGLPKTVVLSVEGVDRFLEWAAGQFTSGPGTTVLNYAPLNFDLCLLDIWATLNAGGCVELVEPARATNGRYLRELCRRRPIDLIQAVPMFYRLLADTASDAEDTFTSLAHVIFTGDVMPLNLLSRLPALFPRAKLWNVYGCTETNDTFLHEVNVSEALDRGAVAIGRPITGVTTRIVDEAGAVVPAAGSGELLVASPFQAHGYLDPRLTGQKWRDGFYHTGDLVTRDQDGLVFLAGRNDFHVKVRGVRTNLQEVEHVVLGHEDVLEAAVIAVPDEITGHQLRAVVRRRPRSSLDSIQLRVHCAAKLPRTAIPALVEIVDDELPRTSTGKVDRRVLATLEERNRRVD
ncbi:MAG: AMP-binding protein, partial [Kibdelosporangium sp.]